MRYLLLLLLLVGCGEPPDPETLKNVDVSFGTDWGIGGPNLFVRYEMDGAKCERRYKGEQAVRLLRQWLVANYPEEPDAQ